MRRLLHAHGCGGILRGRHVNTDNSLPTCNVLLQPQLRDKERRGHAAGQGGGGGAHHTGQHKQASGRWWMQPKMHQAVYCGCWNLAAGGPAPATASKLHHAHLMTRPLLPSPSSCSSSRMTAAANKTKRCLVSGSSSLRADSSAEQQPHAPSLCPGAQHAMPTKPQRMPATPPGIHSASNQEVAPPTRVFKHAQPLAGPRHQQAAALRLRQHVRPPLLAPKLHGVRCEQ